MESFKKKLAAVAFTLCFLPLSTLANKPQDSEKAVKQDNQQATTNQSTVVSNEDESSTWQDFAIDLAAGARSIEMANKSLAAFSVPTIPSLSAQLRYNAKIIHTAALIHFGLAYTLVNNKLYLAFEPFFEWANSKNDANIVNHTVVGSAFLTQSATTKFCEYTGGLDFKFGNFFRPTSLFYFLIGGERQQVTLTSAASAANTGSAGIVSAQDKHTLWAGRFGLGIQKWLTKHWALHLNYIYSLYSDRNKELQGSTTTGATAGTLSTQSKFHMSISNVLAGVDYYWRGLPAQFTHDESEFTNPWTGFIISVFGGVIENQFLQNNATLQGTGPSQQLTPTNTFDFGNYKAQGGISLGWEWQLKRFVFALTGFFDYAKRSDQSGIISTSPVPTAGFANLSINTCIALNDAEGGIDALPSIILGNDTLLRGRVGVAYNKAKLNVISQTLTGGSPSIFRSSKDKTVYGWRVGLGLEERIDQTLAVSLDYVYTGYGKVSLNRQPFSSVKLHTQAFLFGVTVRPGREDSEPVAEDGKAAKGI